MNIPNTQGVESNLLTQLSKNVKLETLLNALTTQYPQNKLQLCDFLYFCIINELFLEPNTTALILVYLKCAHDVGASTYILDLLGIVLSLSTSVYKLAILNFLADPKLTLLLPLEIESIKPHLMRIYTEKTSVEVNSTLFSAGTKLLKAGPEPTLPAVFLFREADFSKNSFENYSETGEILSEVRALGDSEELSLKIDYLLPIPVELSIEVDDFLTPFPFILEAPILNPHLPYSTMVNEMVRNCSKLSENEVGVF